MIYNEYKPSKDLGKYVKCYYTISCAAYEVVEDKAFATGCIEIMFTLDGRPWETGKDTASIQLWGQILDPLAFRSVGHSEIFGIRFYPATASVLLRGDVSRFNNKVFDLSDVIDDSIKDLHVRLQDERSVNERIQLVDAYLVKRLRLHTKIDLVQRVMEEVTHRDFFDNIDNVASRYGITSRYLQKIFVQYTGLTPKVYARINRFQNSLVRIGKGNISLTEASYECGYFDQSHFIREFKSFTGLSPSAFIPENSTAILASPNK